jgi:hypothetical protein
MAAGSQNKQDEIYLNPNNFTVLDLIRLINILKIKFDLNCVLKRKASLYLICIPKNETKKLHSTVGPHIYKLYRGSVHIRGFHISSYSQLRLSIQERAAFNLPHNLKDIIVGLTLRDLHMQKQSKGRNPNLQFSQGLIHKDYIFHLYDLFKGYCSSEPKISEQKPHSVTGKVYTRVRFNTNCLPCFNEMYYLFYPEGKKIIPLNIGELLTAQGLAY